MNYTIDFINRMTYPSINDCTYGLDVDHKNYHKKRMFPTRINDYLYSNLHDLELNDIIYTTSDDYVRAFKTLYNKYPHDKERILHNLFIIESNEDIIMDVLRGQENYDALRELELVKYKKTLFQRILKKLT